MRVKVKLFATLRRYMPGAGGHSPMEIDLPEGGTLRDILELLRIAPEEARITFVNGIIHEQDWVLKDGDEVGMFPPIGGG